MREKQIEQPNQRPQRQPSRASRPRGPVADPAARGLRVPPPPVPAQMERGMAWELTIAPLVVAILIASLASLLAMEIWLSGRVMPGVYAWDVDLGGLTRDQAVERLQTSFHFPRDRHPALRYHDQRWSVDPAILGVRLDAPATVDAALEVGHTGGLRQCLGEQLYTLFSGRLVTPVLVSDPNGGGLYLSGIAGQVNRPLRNASLSLNDDLSVNITPGQAGREMDEEGTRKALLQRIAEMAGGDVALVVRESQPLLTDLSAAQAQVQRILRAPVVLTAPGFDPWTLDQRTLAGWLILRPTGEASGSATLSVSLDPGQTTRLAEQIAAQVAREPSNAQFRWSDASGGLVAVVDSVAGQTLDVTKAVTLIEQAATSDRRSVPLPLNIIRPQLATEDAPSLGITELIGEGITHFAGSSAARIQNITVGAAQFDGLLIPPGETFSFNQYLGEVTAEQGYAEGIIIWGNTTRADVGGGLCQVSSTAFRAAFWAGLPITERHAHAFRVSYYEPPKGLDATIYSPSVDLKWVNDTGHTILVHTYVDTGNDTLTFRYYGTNPGRTVQIDGPYESNPVPHDPVVYRDDPTLPKGEKKQIEWAKDGLDVTVYRIIKVNGEEVGRDTFFSRYLPWQAVYLVGTKQ